MPSRAWEVLKPDIVAQVDTVGIPQFWLLNTSRSSSESQQAVADCTDHWSACMLAMQINSMAFIWMSFSFGNKRLRVVFMPSDEYD